MWKDKYIMTQLHETIEDRGLILYTSKKQILLRQKNGALFLQPKVVAVDYQRDLADIEYNSTLYYSYINEDGALLIRSLLSEVIPYKLEAGQGQTITKPLLVSRKGKLLLFFLIGETKQPTSLTSTSFSSPGTDVSQSASSQADLLPASDYVSVKTEYTLYCLLPYEDAKLLGKWQLDSTSPTYQVVAVDIDLYVFIAQNGSPQFFHMNPELQVEPLHLCPPLPDPSALEERDKTIEMQQSQILSLQAQMKDLQAQLEKKQKECSYYQTQLDSAITQYNELMEVAQKYKDEVMKYS